MNLEYRLTFESINSHQAAAIEAAEGRDIWKRLTDAEWGSLEWMKPTTKITTDPWSQYYTLKKWAETHEQPIRNVKLEQREAPLLDEGWVEVNK